MKTPQHPLGRKIQQAMEGRGWNRTRLAEHFGIKLPSVTELLKTGRLAKKHYPKLVELNGKGLDWWFDSTNTAAAPRTGTHVAHKASEPPSSYHAVAATTQIEDELLRLFQALPEIEQTRFMDELRQKAEHYNAVFKEMLERQHLTTRH
jgi:hypothetical protein